MRARRRHINALTRLHCSRTSKAADAPLVRLPHQTGIPRVFSFFVVVPDARCLFGVTAPTTTTVSRRPRAPSSPCRRWRLQSFSICPPFWVFHFQIIPSHTRFGRFRWPSYALSVVRIGLECRQSRPVLMHPSAKVWTLIVTVGIRGVVVRLHCPFITWDVSSCCCHRLSSFFVSSVANISKSTFLYVDN